MGLSSGRLGLIDLSDRSGLGNGALVQLGKRILTIWLVTIVELKGLKRSALPIHSLAIRNKVIIGGTMDGPFVVSLDALDEPVWCSSFGYQGVACSSVSLHGNFFLSSFRSLPPSTDQPSRHVINEIVESQGDRVVADPSGGEKENQMGIKNITAEDKTDSECTAGTALVHDHFWECKSQSSHKMPFRSALLASPSSDHFQLFLADEQTAAGQCYLLEAGDKGQVAGCPQLMPIEVFPTNAGIPVVDCCVGQIAGGGSGSSGGGEEMREVLALLTEKHLYLYSN